MTRQQRIKLGNLADQVRLALKLTLPITYLKLGAAVKLMGGTVREEANFRLKDEASIRKIGGSFEIVLDGLKPDKRKLFSLAHELGHLFVHMGFGDRAKWNVERDYIESYARNGYDEEEYQANEFAAALLMPENEFKSLYAQKQSIAEIAGFFGVSTDAAEVRAKWLGLLKWS